MIYTIVLHDVPLKMCNQNTLPDFLRCQKMRYSHPRYKYDHNQKIQHISWGHITEFHLGSRTILCLIHHYHASRRIRRVKRFFRKSTSSCVNSTTHTLKPTQMVQSVSRKWQLLHFTLKTLTTPELFVYETAPPCSMQS